MMTSKLALLVRFTKQQSQNCHGAKAKINVRSRSKYTESVSACAVEKGIDDVVTVGLPDDVNFSAEHSKNRRHGEVSATSRDKDVMGACSIWALYIRHYY
jgi:hypothetical protein